MLKIDHEFENEMKIINKDDKNGCVPYRWRKQYQNAIINTMSKELGS